MLFKIDTKVIHNYPGITIGVVVAHNINAINASKEAQQIFKKAQESIRAALTTQALGNHPHIIPWLEAYKKFGANPKKYIPSVKNLGERVIKKDIGSINTLVDLYNSISLHYLLPAGGEDLEAIVGDIILTVAGEHEKAALLLGDKEPSIPEPDEVFYKDDNGAICRRWNWREADRTKLTPTTKHALFVLEAIAPIDSKIVKAATHQLASMIQHFCGGSVSTIILNAENPEVILKQGSTYLTLQPVLKEPVIPAEEIYAKTSENSATNENSQEHTVRLATIQALKEAGLEPWPAGKEVTATAAQVIAEFDETKESAPYAVAGRVMTLREHGKTAFVTIQDRTGKLQIYIRQDVVGEQAFAQFKKFIDLGDIIWVTGPSFRTKTGEITLKAQEVTLLSKSLHPLPEKFHGLADIEIAYRQRYLDLISNPESRERFKKRSTIVRVIRNFLDSHDFMEVETPMLQVIPGGAAARPFITHHNALDMDLYLRIAPELYLKRLVVGGFERVYEINRNFRNEGISTKHNPEFTMLEFYIAYKDYYFAMDLVEELLRKVSLAVNNSLHVTFGEQTLDFEKSFARMSMYEAVKLYGKLSDADLTDKGIDAVLSRHSITLANKQAAWGHKLYALFEALVEPNLVNPTFITEFPIEVSPLAKRDPKNPHIAARFELFIAGVELSNGFNELNDPFDQAERFREQAKDRSAGDVEAHHYDADYVQALEYALPPTAGVGIGIDRLTMFLTNTTSIKDVILFPTLKKRD